MMNFELFLLKKFNILKGLLLRGKILKCVVIEF